MTACPSSDSLAQLLAGDLAEPDAVRRHVGECAACQAMLDRLSDDTDLQPWLPRGPALPVEPGEGAALAGVLEALRQTYSLRPPVNTPAEPRKRSISFLAPPRREGDLGTLGPYGIEAELGRGGMGIVFRAYDPSLRRTVAVKVLPPELDSAKARARFVHEAQATAQVNHDHVIRVQAVVNPPDGLPYFVMDYLAGTTLADELRRLGRLEPSVAAAIAGQVADGLAAAHAAGLIHRDVKPSNILLDAVTGRAILMDFGLAQVAEHPSGLTQEGHLVGTPAYMSPEQARGQKAIDQRSDMYSLGVTLYEAVTGEIPFRGVVQMVLPQILQEEPRPPRQLNDRVPRDLETICLKAMAKEASRRYQTAQELSDDLKRWQRGEPIRARPVGRLERAWRWCRRNPRVAGLTVALVLVFAAGFGGVLWQWRQADRQRGLAEDKSAEAQRQRDLAEDNLRQACRAVDQFYTRVSTEALLRQPGAQPLRRQLLQQALTFYQDFLVQRGEDPFLQEEMAQACYNVALIAEQIGTTAEAEAAYQKAIDRYRRLVQTQPAANAFRSKLAESHLDLGRVLTKTSRLPEALVAFREAAALMEALSRDYPDNRIFAGNLCACYGNIANLEVKLDQRDTARRTYERLRTRLEDILRDQPQHRGFLRNLALTENNLGVILPAREAVACLERARALREQLVCVDPSHLLYSQDLARTDMNLGVALTAVGRKEEALISYGRALTILETLAEDNPAVKELREHLAQAYLNRGAVQADLEQREEALVSLMKARDLYQQLHREDPSLARVQGSLAMVYRNLGRLHLQMGRPTEAVRCYQQAIGMFRPLLADPSATRSRN